METRTPDDCCERHGVGKVDFIKCDVEGHEIEGARRPLAHHRPALLVKVNELLDAGGHGTRGLELVRSLGYRVETLRVGRLEPWSPGEVAVNYVLRPL